mmetsp:Transcript_27365/g.40402  ORF Transcript_27365/g.40402 Transcript_27365/m.40402 type:complete len:131 (+) Transcript_27365:125-517(+)
MCQKPENEQQENDLVDVELGKFTSIDESFRYKKEGMSTYCKVLIFVALLMLVLGSVLLAVTMSKDHNEWPECLGMDGDECCDLITKQSPDITKCYVLTEGSYTIKNYDLSRVWVFVEESTNMVTEIPGRG